VPVASLAHSARRREHGESKLTLRQNLLYVLHLAHLYVFAYPVGVSLAVVAVLLVAYQLLALLASSSSTLLS
jgi:hypothetical protein